MRYRLLGEVTASAGDTRIDLGGPKQRAVLALLALEPGRVVPLDRLISMMWGDDAPERAEVSIRSYVSNLRRVLGPLPSGEPVIEFRRPGYVLHASAEDVDVGAFETHVSRARAALDAGDPRRAIDQLRAADALWTGAPLSGVDGDVELTATVTRLEGRRLESIGMTFDARLALGEHAALVADIGAAVAERPLEESLRTRLALALYRAGRQVDALRAIDEARRTLADEIGVDPGPELRALEAAILAHDPALDWQPATERPSADAPVDNDAHFPDTHPGDTVPFVGRDDELGATVAALDGALGGAGRVAVVDGEAGIGKTRLVEELARRARSLGATVAWSHCPEDTAAVSYWPWRQLATDLAATTSSGTSGERLGELLDPLDTNDPGVDAEAAQFALRAATVDALRGADGPLLLVIDDLQWADSASLRLLAFVGDDLHRLPILVAVTVRAAPADASPELQQCLADLARTRDAVRLSLGGLDAAAVGSWLDAQGDAPIDDSVATAVHDRTGGNPFFVRELVALLTHDRRLDDPGSLARLDALPAAVQDVVRRRASRLPPATQQLLSTAAVVGRRFDLDIVATVADLEPVDALERLEPAIDAELFVPDEQRAARFSFSHALVAETLASEPGAARRARLHAATFAALSARRGDVDEVVPELAHHALAGAAAGTAGAAVDYSERAARLAGRAHAPADAAVHWRNGLRALELADPSDRTRRAELTHQLGVSLGGAGDTGAAHDALVEAAAQFDAIGDPHGMARSLAVVHSDDLWSGQEWHQADARAMELFERALAAVGHEPAVRAELLSALSSYAYNVDDVTRADELSAEAVELARQHAEPIVRARTLLQRWWALWRPSRNADRTAAAAEMVELVEHHDLPERFEPLAHLAAFTTAFERGDRAGTDHHLARARATCVKDRMLVLHAELLWAEMAVHLGRGHYGEAMEHVLPMYDEFMRTRAFVAGTCHDTIVYQALTDQGRLGEVLETVFGLEDTLYEQPGQWYYASGYARAGDYDEASKRLARFDGILRDDWYRPMPMLAGLYAAVGVGRDDVVAHCAEVLRPVADTIALAGSGGAVGGPISLGIATADARLGHPERAAESVEVAIDQSERMGLRPWLARSLALRHQLGGDDADRSRAEAIAAEIGLVDAVFGLG